MADRSDMRRRRRAMKLTGEEAAEGLGVSHSTYQRWERGEQRPHLRKQRDIARFFAVPIHTVDEWFPDRPARTTRCTNHIRDRRRHTGRAETA